MTSIGSDAFSGCMAEIVWGGTPTITEIGDYAFANYAGTSITIPDSVTSIGGSAFEDCDSLERITLPFVGATKDGTSNTHFGYIFGASSYSSNGNYVPTLLKEVIITGGTSIGEYAFRNCTSLTSITIPDSVTSIGYYAFAYCTSLASVTIPESVTSIGSYAFYNCTSLTSVTIPESVTSIGSYAFRYCTSLESITIPFVGATKDGTSNTHFGYIFGASSYSYNGNCVPSSLKEVIITGGTSIGDWTFRGCNSLTTVTIPDSVTSIGENAFSGCNNLQYNEYGDALYLGNDANPYLLLIKAKDISITSVDIHGSTRVICPSAFYGCTSLTSVTIPDSVASIGDNAFYDCDSLISVTIGNGVTSIGYDAFFNCNSLEAVYITDIGKWAAIDFGSYSSNPLYYAGNLYLNGEPVAGDLVIPDGVTSIGDYAFYGCDALTSITIPGSVTYIGRSAFSGCTSLTSVTIPDSVTSIGNDAFRDCTSLTSVTIPDSVASIGAWAFEDCDSLTSVTIGSGVTSIGYEAFFRCTSLEAVYITDIGKWAAIDFDNYAANPLYYAGNLYLNGELVTDLVIPDGVTSIGDYAFDGCTSLTSVTIPDGVTSIGDDAFDGCDRLQYNEFGNALYLGNDANPYLLLVKAKNKSITSVDIHGSTRFIYSSAFSSCTSLTSITIPDSVTSIGEWAFHGCAAEIIWGGTPTITEIGYYEFAGYAGTSITIPDSVTSIGRYAFSGCDSLTSVTIPSSVTSIGSFAFEDCASLTSVTFEGTMAEWKAVEKGLYWNSDCPFTEVRCSGRSVSV